MKFVAQNRITIGVCLCGLILFVGFFFYERHRDNESAKVALASCIRQNVHRKASNRQTLILKDIMIDVAQRQYDLAAEAQSRGNEAAAKRYAKIGDEWSEYDRQLHRVPLAPCYSIYGFKPNKERR